MFCKDYFGIEQDVRHYLAGEYMGNEHLIGIEIEVEGIRWVEIPPYWRTIEDGSLRDGFELVLRQPLTGKDLEDALDHAERELQDKEMPDSPRTSVHVHIDVRDATFEEIRSLLFLYAVFEDHFFLMGGEQRKDSFYCAPWSTSSAQMKAVQMLLNARNRGLAGLGNKYSALNIQTMQNYGSVEFRMHQGTTNMDDIRKFIQDIYALRSYVKGNAREDLMDYLNEYSRDGAKSLFRDIFGRDTNINHDVTMRSAQALVAKPVTPEFIEKV